LWRRAKSPRRAQPRSTRREHALEVRPADPSRSAASSKPAAASRSSTCGGTPSSRVVGRQVAHASKVGARRRGRRRLSSVHVGL
jgi:hypothetical protein